MKYLLSLTLLLCGCDAAIHLDAKIAHANQDLAIKFAEQREAEALSKIPRPHYFTNCYITTNGFSFAESNEWNIWLNESYSTNPLTLAKLRARRSNDVNWETNGPKVIWTRELHYSFLDRDGKRWWTSRQLEYRVIVP